MKNIDPKVDFLIFLDFGPSSKKNGSRRFWAPGQDPGSQDPGQDLKILEALDLGQDLKILEARILARSSRSWKPGSWPGSWPGPQDPGSQDPGEDSKIFQDQGQCHQTLSNWSVLN